MNGINISFAKYNADPISGTNASVQATINGVIVSVPLDPAISDYAEIMRQVEAGELTIEPADSE